VPPSGNCHSTAVRPGAAGWGAPGMPWNDAIAGGFVVAGVPATATGVPDEAGALVPTVWLWLHPASMPRATAAAAETGLRLLAGPMRRPAGSHPALTVALIHPPPQLTLLADFDLALVALVSAPSRLRVLRHRHRHRPRVSIGRPASLSMAFQSAAYRSRVIDAHTLLQSASATRRSRFRPRSRCGPMGWLGHSNNA
jgi:hypothetical protein